VTIISWLGISFQNYLNRWCVYCTEVENFKNNYWWIRHTLHYFNIISWKLNHSHTWLANLKHNNILTLNQAWITHVHHYMIENLYKTQMIDQIPLVLRRHETQNRYSIMQEWRRSSNGPNSHEIITDQTASHSGNTGPCMIPGKLLQGPILLL